MKNYRHKNEENIIQQNLKPGSGNIWKKSQSVVNFDVLLKAVLYI